jgi:hypothetical protein
VLRTDLRRVRTRSRFGETGQCLKWLKTRTAVQRLMSTRDIESVAFLGALTFIGFGGFASAFFVVCVGAGTAVGSAMVGVVSTTFAV